MTRTIAEVYQEIVSYKDSQSPLNELAPNADTEQQLLTDLTSNSKVAIWRLWAYITAVAIHTHEVLWSLFKTEVQEIAALAITGPAIWYQLQVFLFQYDDSIFYNTTTNKYEYEVIDETKRIVKRCAVLENETEILTLKVAKEENGDLIALTNDEQMSLAAYIKKIRFAGTRFQIVSGNGDILKVNGAIYYDGIHSRATVQNNVENAIIEYIAGLPFDGKLFLIRLIDKIQLVEGVIDVAFTNVQTKPLASNNFTTINRLHTPQFGYYIIDDTVGNRLQDTLMYVIQ